MTTTTSPPSALALIQEHTNALSRETQERWAAEQLVTVWNTVARGASLSEFAMFMALADRYGLNPLAKEIWFVKAKDGKTMILVGRDGLLAIARRQPDFVTIDGDVHRKNDTFRVTRAANGARTVEHSYEGGPEERGDIVGSWAMVERTDGRFTNFTYCPLGEYSPAGGGQSWSPWKKQTSAMIQKCSVSLALRIAYGISGVVGEDEVFAQLESQTRELTEGEGTGEPAGIELPSSVEKIIARAESLGHDGWAYRPAWELKVGRIGFDVEAEVAKATAELDAFKEKMSEEPEGSDVPIDLEGLPEPPVLATEPTVEGAVYASAAEAAVKAAEESKESPGGEKRVQEGPTGEEDMPPVIQETPKAARRRSAADTEKPSGSDDIEVLRARRRLYEELSADTEDEEAEKAAYLDALDRQIAALGQKEADENPEQQTLI